VGGRLSSSSSSTQRKQVEQKPATFKTHEQTWDSYKYFVTSGLAIDSGPCTYTIGIYTVQKVDNNQRQHLDVDWLSLGGGKWKALDMYYSPTSLQQDR
jgi:hypothetical protein